MYRQTLRRLFSILVLITVASALAVAPQFARAPSAFANVGFGGSSCGVLTLYVAATPLAAGELVIGGTGYAIAPGTTLSGNPSFLLGSNVCLTATLDGSGQIVGGTLTPYAASNVNVCGVVTAFSSPTALTAGYVVINGQSYLIAPNNSLGLTVLTLGTSYCLTSSLNGVGQLVGGTLTPVTAPAPATAVNVCGVITAYTLSTASTAGSITLGGQVYGIVPGVTPSGAALLAIAANPTLCLQATLNGAGQITSGSLTTTLTGTPTVNVCGTVTAYTAATATAAGTITVVGNTLTISPGAVFVGVAQPAVGTAVCLSLVVNSAGAIVGGSITVTSTGVPLSATVATAHHALRSQALRE